LLDDVGGDAGRGMRDEERLRERRREREER
jgi:hypothetical protein